MRWNCPHCGVALAVSDDKLGAGWTFSRCYKCGGFALVRKAEVSLIKVDKAPNGEKILLPEGHEVPALSNSAVKNLAQIIQSGGTPKATILPSTRKQHAPRIAMPPPFRKSVNVVAKALPPPMIEDAGPATATSRLPNILPYAVTLAGLAAMGSGFYLYRQGQNLARHAAQSTAAAESLAQEESGPLTDQVEAPAQAAPDRRPAIDPVPTTPPAAAPAPAPVTQAPVVPTTVAAAIQKEAPTVLPGLVVRPRSAMVMLRTGPGTEFKELGYANADLQYVVTEWKERWFKVLVQDSRQTAWVRNDLVSLTRVEGSQD